MPLQSELISLCKKGDRKAQRLLFEQGYPLLFRLCLRYVSVKEDAEDCLMKGWVKVFKSLDGFQSAGAGSFDAWIKKIMVHECLMFLRKKSYLLFTGDSLPEVQSIQAEVLHKTDAEALYRMVLALPAGYRTVFNLFAIEGYSHKEIAAMLSITESTSKTQFSKARNKLASLLDKNEQYGSAGK